MPVVTLVSCPVKTAEYIVVQVSTLQLSNDLLSYHATAYQLAKRIELNASCTSFTAISMFVNHARTCSYKKLHGILSHRTLMTAKRCQVSCFGYRHEIRFGLADSNLYNQ